MNGQSAKRFSTGSIDDSLDSLTEEQRDDIRLKVQRGIADIERGDYTDYVGRAGLGRLTEDVIARGRERLKLAQDRNR
jgi:hypothetical protein